MKKNNKLGCTGNPSIKSICNTTDRYEELYRVAEMRRQESVKVRKPWQIDNIEAHIKHKEQGVTRIPELKKMMDVQHDELLAKITRLADIEDAEKALEIYSEEIALLKKWSDELLTYLDKPQRTAYDNLFIDLARANSKFALYIPAYLAMLARADISNFSDKEIKTLQTRFEDAEMFSDKYVNRTEMQRHYLKFFPKYVNLMNDFNQAKFVLNRHPEFYPIIKENFSRVYINDKSRFYSPILKIQPLIVNYFNNEDFENVSFMSTFYAVLAQNPELLGSAKFPKGFFTSKILKHNKFGNYNKEQLLVIFKDYLDKYPELKQYLTTKTMHNYSTKIYDDTIEF